MRITNHIYLVGSGPYGLSHEFDSNIYLVDCEGALVLIDTGAGIDVKRILNNIKTDGFNFEDINHIFLTHSHADHSGGACELKKIIGSQVYISEIEADLLDSDDERKIQLDVAKRSGLYSPDYKFKPCKASKLIKNGDRITIGRFSFRVIIVPGHSKGSTCYFVELPEGKAVFTGDVVFFDGAIGLLNCEGSELSDYRKYISRLKDLDVDILLPGHYVFTICNSQKHIDKAIEALKLIGIPKNFL